MSISQAKLLLRSLPQSGLSWSCCYGSILMEQQSSPDSQLDVIVAIKESLIDNWHLENLRINPSHYSSISRLFGSKFIMYLQKIPPSFSYHPFIQVENTNQLFKYGVISTEDLIHDLKTWEYLYSAGRLQKPIAVLPFGDCADKDRIDEAMQLNYIAAVAVALIMLPDQFTKSQLYKTISSIS
jgi:mitochondrial translocator assembly and maintenance protein 41